MQNLLAGSSQVAFVFIPTAATSSVSLISYAASAAASVPIATFATTSARPVVVVNGPNGPGFPDRLPDAVAAPVNVAAAPATQPVEARQQVAFVKDPATGQLWIRHVAR